MYITYFPKYKSCHSKEEFDREVYKKKHKIVTNTNAQIKMMDYTTSHTLLQERINYIIAQWQSYSSEYGYTEFKIPKHSEGYRTIDAPNDKLKKLQRDILDIFKNGLKILPHNAAHGFTSFRNPKTMLEIHQNNKSRWFLKVDIKDFFGSTTKEMLIETLLKQDVRTCQMSNIRIIIDICTKDGILPQGAPTSPMFANMVMTLADEHITKALPGIVYTRYADDMLFSSKSEFSKDYVIKIIKEAFEQNKLTYEINEKKTRYGNFNGRNWNLGLMYNNQHEITVGAKNKKLIKNRIHNWHHKREGKSYAELLLEMQQINGKLGYYKFIEPKYFKSIPYLIKGELPNAFTNNTLNEMDIAKL